MQKKSDHSTRVIDSIPESIIEPSITEFYLPIAGYKSTLRWIYRYLCTQKRLTSFTILGSGLGAIFNNAMAVFLGNFIDLVSGENSGSRHGTLVNTISGTIVVTVLAIIFTSLSGYTLALLSARILARLREHVLEAALFLPRTQIEQAGSGDLLSRLSNDVTIITEASTLIVPTVVNGVIMTIAALGAMSSIDWRLGAAGALALPAYAVALYWYLPLAMPQFLVEREAESKVSGALIESLYGRKTILAHGLGMQFTHKFDAIAANSQNISVNIFARFTKFVSRINRAEFIGLCSILLIGWWGFHNRSMTIGQISAAILIFHRLFNPIANMMFYSDMALNALVSLARLIGIAEQNPADQSHLYSLITFNHPPKINFTNVSFAYHSGKEILHDFSLEIPAGSLCALIGATGAGKSTVAALLGEVYQPKQGNITVDNYALHCIQADQIVTLTQEVHIFTGSIADNLLLAKPDASIDEIWEALRVVEADQWIASLPDGLDTLVGEGYMIIDPGMAQHISLARAQLMNPKVLILDEASAEAGSIEGARLDRAVRKVCQGKTSLIIVHRLNIVPYADYIVVLEHGRIIQTGTHQQLLSSEGFYRQLWEAWE